MTDNRYAPPTAKVSDVPSGGVAPALWNPNAAANWSLLLTPIFGAFVQMKNWEALDEPDRAASSKKWAIVSAVLTFGPLLLVIMMPGMQPLRSVPRLVGLVLLISWYFASGRGQAEYVKSRFGSDYERRGWAKPLLCAFGAMIGLVMVFVLLTGVVQPVRVQM